MEQVRKFMRTGALVALVLLVLVGVGGIVAFVVHHPRSTSVVAAIALVALVLLGVVVRRIAPSVKRGTIIELDLAEMPTEGAGRNPLTQLSPNKQLKLDETIEALRRAADDKRVAGLILRPRFSVAPRAALDELRDALVAFGESGKFTIAIADSFGDGGPANGAYILATACREIVVQESGYVGLTHMTAEANFYPGLLERAGVEMEVFGRGKYKSAPNQFTERGFTAADREQTKRMLEAFWERGAGLISDARKIDVTELQALAEQGPLGAAAALEAGLVDRLAFPDVAVEEAKRRVGDRASLLYLHLYKKRAGKGRPARKPVTVAVIRAAGEIHREAGGLPIGLSGGPVLAPSTITPHIRAAIKDKKVKAVVVRIDSPGGSALASDSIWRELVRVRETGKPLVASMANVAASGGYYIAAAADRIVAEPTTVTGSIGVFGMRPIIAEAKAKLDIAVDEIHTGKSPQPSLNRGLTPAQRKRVNADIDNTYELFMARVGEGRKMARDAVYEVAQGRVWTGADAAEVRLVDELGGLHHAVDLAMRLTEAPAGATAKIKHFPKKSSGVSMLRRRKGDSSDDLAAAASLGLGSWNLRGLGGVQAHLGLDPRVFWIR